MSISRSESYLCFALILVCHAGPSYAQVDCQSEFYPGRVLVRFKPNTAMSAKTNVHRSAGSSRTIRSFRKIDGLELVEVAVGHERAAAELYKRNTSVLYAEPDYLLHLQEEPHFGKQWGLSNSGNEITGCTGCPDPGTVNADIDAKEAWSIWTGDPDFLIGVVDTGVNFNHADLQANIWHNPGEIGLDALNRNKSTNGEDDDGNGCIDDVHGCNFFANPPNGDVMDTNSHGTHVAGIIAGKGDNNTGISGVNWHAKIVALKIGLPGTNCSAASDAIQAMDYCIANNIQLTNHSWGGTGSCTGLCDSFATANSQITGGHLAVVSAGNVTIDTPFPNNDSVPMYPASCSSGSIIAVASIDNDAVIASTSHYGATSVDVGAPGVNIYSTVLSNDYDFKSGTSMAAPHVTGLVALLWSRTEWSSSQVKARVLETVTPIRSLHQFGDTPVFTQGMINAYRALA